MYPIANVKVLTQCYYIAFALRQLFQNCDVQIQAFVLTAWRQPGISVAVRRIRCDVQSLKIAHSFTLKMQMNKTKKTKYHIRHHILFNVLHILFNVLQPLQLLSDKTIEPQKRCVAAVSWCGFQLDDVGQ